MKSLPASLMFLTLTASAGVAATPAPIAGDDCLSLSAELRDTDLSKTDKLTAHLQWLCDPSVVQSAKVNLRVNDVPVTTAHWAGQERLAVSVIVPERPLPLKVCADVEGFADSGQTTVMARQCHQVTGMHVDLPMPIRVGDALSPSLPSIQRYEPGFPRR